MNLFGREVTGYAKALVILSAVFLVASGLCGLEWVIVAHSQGSAYLLLPLGILELAAMALSAIGIVVVLFIWIGSTIYKRIANPGDTDPQKLFDATDESKHDDLK